MELMGFGVDAPGLRFGAGWEFLCWGLCPIHSFAKNQRALLERPYTKGSMILWSIRGPWGNMATIVGSNASIESSRRVCILGPSISGSPHMEPQTANRNPKGPSTQ